MLVGTGTIEVTAAFASTPEAAQAALRGEQVSDVVVLRQRFQVEGSRSVSGPRRSRSGASGRSRPPLTPPPVPVPSRRALIIAYNEGNRIDVPDLRYADDDGLRWFEVFRRLGIEAELLTVPDAETAAVSATFLAGVKEPSRANVDAAVRRLADLTRADHATGAVVDAYVVYVGHGQTDAAGKATLTLLDGTVDQSALYTSWWTHRRGLRARLGGPTMPAGRWEPAAETRGGWRSSARRWERTGWPAGRGWVRSSESADG